MYVGMHVYMYIYIYMDQGLLCVTHMLVDEMPLHETNWEHVY